MKTEYQLSAIGHVSVAEDGYCLQLDKAYAPALEGLEGFSYLNVLWWAHYLDNEEARAFRTCEKPYKNAPGIMGIFATRSPARPNPLCLSVVPVIHIDYENGKIYTPYLDAEDGTPILDIKPYHPATDRVRDVSIPDWCRQWPEWLEDSADFDWSTVF
ncbi:MAG: SAM-dependent methyltransferase, partial [Anaerolineales bacterium]